ncbi:MAG: hypothetical protein NTY19_23745 [Planctomycetota bacterium]|nr:hypothetical protein [Planctomycetota bacterium]
MLRGEFRPWGSLSWVLAHLRAKKWSLLGCIATGERCLAAWEILASQRVLTHALMMEIHDEHPDGGRHSRFYEKTEAKLKNRMRDFVTAGGNKDQIAKFYLSDFHGRIVDATDSFAAGAGSNVIIDISALPKRFFFPMIRRLLSAGSIENLIATYSVPDRYADGQLAEDPGPWMYLPTFLPPDPEPEEKVLIVGLGYEPLGLRQVLQGKDFNLLFPFPSLSPGIRRNWEFVRELIPLLRHEPQRVYIYDVSETYERIAAMTDFGRRYAVVAPYGPKTTSLAMCLYAVSDRASLSPPAVYYTQPRVYNPDYSIGIKKEGGVPKVLAYCLRLGGRNLY